MVLAEMYRVGKTPGAKKNNGVISITVNLNYILFEYFILFEEYFTVSIFAK